MLRLSKEELTMMIGVVEMRRRMAEVHRMGGVLARTSSFKLVRV